MAKTLIDIDEDLLRDAQEYLGTSTKRETVNAALRELLRRRARMREIQRIAAGETPDFGDPSSRAEAWR